MASVVHQSKPAHLLWRQIVSDLHRDLSEPFLARGCSAQMPDDNNFVAIDDHGLTEAVGSDRGTHLIESLSAPLAGVLGIVARPIDRPPAHLEIVHRKPAPDLY